MSKKRSVFWAVLPLVVLLFVSCAVSVDGNNGNQRKSVDKSVLSGTAVPSVSPFDMVKRLGHGINLGNTLDAPYEGAWAKSAEEYYFDDYKAAGFNSVRIPVTWANHMGTSYPYTVDSAFMARVTQVVNWALARNLAVVLNCHHEDWIRTNYPAAQIPRFESLWSQIASNFSNSSENLVFEILNEPQGPISAAQVNDLMSRGLSIIRKTNPTRNVIIGAGSWNGWYAMINELSIPNDSHLIANFHSYDPWAFCGEMQGTWGTSQDIANMASMFSQVKNWSAQKNIPVYAGEYGTRVECDLTSRIAWYKNFCQMAKDNGFAYAAWDDFGWFKIYDRINRTFDSNIKAYITSPDTSTGTVIPSKIEAENYNNMKDVQTEVCSEGSLDVGWIDTGDWMTYPIKVPASGSYTISYRVASPSGAQLASDLNASSIKLGSVYIPATGGWQNWTTVSQTVNLPAGTYSFGIYANTGAWNINWINFTKQSSQSSSSSSVSRASSSKGASSSSVANSGAVNRFQNQYGGNYLNCSANVNGANVVSSTLNTGWTSQQWVMESGGRIRNVWTGLYLNCSADTEGANVVCSTLNTSWTSQQWTRLGNRFQNNWTGRYLTVSGNGNGAQVVCQTLNTSWTSQLWNIQ